MTVLSRVKSLDTSRSSPSSSYDSTSIGRSASLSKRATRRSLRDGDLALDPAADQEGDAVLRYPRVSRTNQDSLLKPGCRVWVYCVRLLLLLALVLLVLAPAEALAEPTAGFTFTPAGPLAGDV